MISIEEYRRALGSLADRLSEEQVLKLREQQDKMAEILFSMWLKELREKSYNEYGEKQ